MGRSQSFDRADVVRAARGVFWERGFDATSVPDLEAATGLSRSSIYNAFGSKRGLFDEAVVSYLDEVVHPSLRRLQGDDVAACALGDYLTTLRAAFASPAGQRSGMCLSQGCMLVNVATAPLAHDLDVAHTVSRYRQDLRAALGRGVEASCPDLDPRSGSRLADVLTALVVEAFVLVRVSPAEALGVLDTAVVLVDPTQGALRGDVVRADIVGGRAGVMGANPARGVGGGN